MQNTERVPDVFHQPLSRRDFLRLSTALILDRTFQPLDTLYLPLIQNNLPNTYINKDLDTRPIEESGQAQYCYSYEQTASLLDHFSNYLPRTNLIKVTNHADSTCTSPEFSLYAPVGHDGQIGYPSPEQTILPQSWFIDTTSGKELMEEDFFDFAMKAGTIAEFVKSQWPSSFSEERKVYLIDALADLGIVDANLPGTGVPPCFSPDWHINLDAKALPGPQEQLQNYQLDEMLFATAHEMFHGIEVDFAMPRYYGKESFANAFAFYALSENLHILHDSNYINNSRSGLATAFFRNKNLRLLGEGNRSEHGYEHAGLIELFRRKSNLSYNEIVNRLSTLPCISDQGLYQDPFPIVFNDESWPNAYVEYLAHVLMQPGKTNDDLFGPIRTLLPQHISSINPGQTQTVGSKEFYFYKFPRQSGEHIPHLRLSEGLMAATVLGGTEQILYLQNGSSLHEFLHFNENELPFVVFNASLEYEPKELTIYTVNPADIEPKIYIPQTDMY